MSRCPAEGTLSLVQSQGATRLKKTVPVAPVQWCSEHIMDDLVRDLPASALVLDLGASGGSFSYASTPARVMALDVAFPANPQETWARTLADSRSLPLKKNVVDVVVCNHTLEHFEDYEASIREIDRVLKPGGFLWAAVPDGFSLDDRFYRYMFEGGGHVNRFSLHSFVFTVESQTALRAQRYKKLHTGFVYLNPPDPVKIQYYPNRAQILGRIPVRLLRAILRWLNYLVRICDRLFGTQWSHYGWGIVFGSSKQQDSSQLSDLKNLASVPEDLNVCFSCGAGHPLPPLLNKLKRSLLWKTYVCPSCGTRNLFVRGES